MSTELALRASPISPRAEEVLDKILSIKGTLMRRSLELGRLLKEARDNNYSLEWGFPRFGDWVENGSGLDMSARSAYYLIQVVEMTDKLGIPDDVTEKRKLSKLKVIASLKPAEMSDTEKRDLIIDAEALSLSEVTKVVSAAKQQEWVNRSYKFDKVAYDEVIVPATERTKREYGSTIAEDGGAADISDSKVIELWAAEKLAEPEEEIEELEADFEDSFEVDDPIEP